MGLTEKIGKIVFVASLLVSVPLNYTYGFRPAYDNVASGMTREESEINLQDRIRSDYCDRVRDRCDPRILIDPVTIPGRVIAYATHEILN